MLSATNAGQYASQIGDSGLIAGAAREKLRAACVQTAIALNGSGTAENIIADAARLEAYITGETLTTALDRKER